MKSNIKTKLVLGFILVFLAIFAYAAILVKNVEFTYYAVIIFSMFLMGYRYRERLHLNPLIFLLLVSLVVAHIIGGFLYVNEEIHLFEREGSTRLYDMEWGPFKYDNIVHFFASFLASIMVYNILVLHMKEIRKHPYLLTFSVVFSTLGIGAVNEIVEFFGVIFFGAAGVGGYFNNAKDLFYNLAGAVWGILVIDWHNSRILKTPLEAAIYNPEKEKARRLFIRKKKTK